MPALDNLVTLRRLVAIVDAGSLQAAARTLSVTQPALTRSVGLLEDALGGVLFERHPRGLRPTPLGLRAAQHARHLLRESQLAAEDLSSLARGSTGSLRLAGAPVWMAAILPSVVSALQVEHPGLRLRLESCNHTRALEALGNGELDVYCGGFQDSTALPGFLAAEHMFRTTLKVVAAATHPVLASPLTSLAPLLDWPWVSYLSDQAYLDTVMDRIEAATGRRREAAVQCDSMLTVLGLLRGGRYLSFLPSSFIASVPRSQLRVLDAPLAEVGFDSGIVYRTSLDHSEALTAFRRLARTRVRACGFCTATGPRPAPGRARR